jgi:3-oxoacyl-[acyl-carrier-protein] synthase-3
MKCTVPNLRIAAIAAAVPENEFDLNSLGSVFGEKEVQRIMHSTGISKIKKAPPLMRCSDFAFAAAEQVLKELKLAASDCDALIFVSQTPDQMLPATSTTLAYRLGMSKSTITLDVNQGCAGYIYGLYLASTLISSGGCQKVMVCAGDVMTPHLDPNDHQVRLVFGDGASATLVEAGTDTFSFSLGSDGSGAEYLHKYGEYLYMDGKKVMEFALREVSPVIDDVIALQAWNKEEVELYALHQANQFMVRYLQKQMRLPVEKVPVSVEGIGNTGPASIPVLLTREYSGSVPKKSILCGFGVGLAWGAVALNLQSTKILPLILLEGGS